MTRRHRRNGTKRHGTKRRGAAKHSRKGSRLRRTRRRLGGAVIQNHAHGAQDGDIIKPFKLDDFIK